MARSKKSVSPEYQEELVLETSRPIAQVTKELGINASTLTNWVNSYWREHAGEELICPADDRAVD